MSDRYISSATNAALLRAVAAIKAANGWTDHELADRIGVPRPFLRNWRSGATGVGPDRLTRIRLFLSRYVENATQKALAEAA